MEIYLKPTAILDSDHPEVVAFAEEAAGDGATPEERAIRLYYAVRDGIWYDPYTPFYRAKDYQASVVLSRKRGFCVPKASLLCALARACEIPSRLGLATVRNHLATREFIEFLGSDLFVYHGFSELYLGGRWVKATPAFNVELCQKHKVEPLEFNGRDDSIFHPYNRTQQKFMEYLEDHGSFADVPVETILASWKETYGERRVQSWIEAFEQKEAVERDFYKEEVVK